MIYSYFQFRIVCNDHAQKTVHDQLSIHPSDHYSCRTRLALPSFMCLNTVATERALSDDTLYTEVTIGHPLLGRLFGYAGELKLQ